MIHDGARACRAVRGQRVVCDVGPRTHREAIGILDRKRHMVIPGSLVGMCDRLSGCRHTISKFPLVGEVGRGIVDVSGEARGDPDLRWYTCIDFTAQGGTPDIELPDPNIIDVAGRAHDDADTTRGDWRKDTETRTRA